MKKHGLAFLWAVAALAGLAVYFAYAGQKPEYGWLVFGPEGRVRVLVRLDGPAVTLEHFLDGKTTGRKEHFKDRQACKEVTLTDPDGKAVYVITAIGGNVAAAGEPTEIMVNVDIQGPLDYSQYGDLVRMAADPNRAPVAHFHGPLTVQSVTINWELPPKLALRRGDKPTDLRACVGTLDAKKACWVVVRSDNGNQSAFPAGMHPFVDVDFPAKQPGDPPLKKRYPLDHFC